MKRLLARLGLASATAMLMVATSAPAPASASPVTGNWYDDGHTLCRYSSSCITSGNIVRFWQALMWVYEVNGFTTADIDGTYGPRTEQATTSFQTLMTPSDVDGWVGKKTWTAAQRFCDDWSTTEYTYFTVCVGGGRSMQLRMRNSDQVWFFLSPRTGLWTGTDH